MRYLLMTFMAFAFSLPHQPVFAGGSPEKEEEPADPSIKHYNRGTRLLFSGRYGSAIKPLRKALAANARFAEAHNNLAFCLRKQGEDYYAEALKHYHKAVSLKAKLPEPYMYRGVLHVQMGNTDLANKDLATLKKLDEDLAEELEWVIENGKEKEPDQFFGVTEIIEE